MKANISGYFQQFSEYYKESIFRRLFVGLIVGSGIWISILIITYIIMLVSNENIWLGTLINDLPGLGFILALLISLQIWGLLPQPVDNHDEQVSTQNSDTIKTTEKVSEKNTDKEENDRDSSEMKNELESDI